MATSVQLQQIRDEQARGKLHAGGQARIRFLLSQAYILLKKREAGALYENPFEEGLILEKLDSYAEDQSVFEGHPETRRLYSCARKALQAEGNYTELESDINALKIEEEKHIEELKVKRRLNKIAIAFAAFMALACGTTIAGSVFMASYDQGWISMVEVLVTIGVTALPIVAVVTIANWWLVKRLISDFEFNHNRWWEKARPNTNSKWLNRILTPFYWLLAVVPGYIINYLFFFYNKTDKEKIQGTTLKEDFSSFAWYFLCFIAVSIYAFFAYATTYDLAVGMTEFAIEEFGVSEALLGTIEIPAIIFGVLMAAATWPAMKDIFVVHAQKWVKDWNHPFLMIDSIPGAKQRNLQAKFLGIALFVVSGFVFTAIAAFEPLKDMLISFGMSSGSGILGTVLVTLAAIGYAPFYLNSTAGSCKAYWDPQARVAARNSKYFPFVRFWNAVLNGLPAVVGVLAMMGYMFSGAASLAVLSSVTLLAVYTSSAGGSYAANYGGTPDTHNLDPDIKCAKANIQTLKELNAEMSVATDLDVMTLLKQQQLGSGSKHPLSQALHKLLKDETLGEDDNLAIYQYQSSTFSNNYFARTFNMLFHTDYIYQHYVQPVKLYQQIQEHGDNTLKLKIELAAIAGSGQAVELYNALNNPGAATSINAADLLNNPSPSAFWRAFSYLSTQKQQVLVSNITGVDRYLLEDKIKQYATSEYKIDLLQNQIADPYKSYLAQLYHSEKKVDENAILAYEIFAQSHSPNIFYKLGGMLRTAIETIAWGVSQVLQFVTGFDAYRAFYPSSKDNETKEQLSEQLLDGDDETKTHFLIDVLNGYAQDRYYSNPSKAETAQKLIKILEGYAIDVELFARLGVGANNDTENIAHGMLHQIFDACCEIEGFRHDIAPMLRAAGQDISQDEIESSKLPETTKMNTQSYFNNTLANPDLREDFTAYENTHRQGLPTYSLLVHNFASFTPEKKKTFLLAEITVLRRDGKLTQPGLEEAASALEKVITGQEEGAPLTSAHIQTLRSGGLACVLDRALALASVTEACFNTGELPRHYSARTANSPYKAHYIKLI